MAQTPFSNKVQILAEAYLDYSGDVLWDETFENYDLGIPLALAIYKGGAYANSVGEGWIDEAWVGVCEMLQVDSHGEYNSLDELIEFSESE